MKSTSLKKGCVPTGGTGEGWFRGCCTASVALSLFCQRHCIWGIENHWQAELGHLVPNRDRDSMEASERNDIGGHVNWWGKPSSMLVIWRIAWLAIHSFISQKIFWIPVECCTMLCAERTVMNKITRLLSWSWHSGEVEHSLSGRIPSDWTINGSHVKWHGSPPPKPEMSGFGCFFESQWTWRGISGNPRHQLIITQTRWLCAGEVLSNWKEKRKGQEDNDWAQLWSTRWTSKISCWVKEASHKSPHIV